MTLNQVLSFARKNNIDLNKEINIMTHCGTSFGDEAGIAAGGIKGDEIFIVIDLDLESDNSYDEDGHLE